MSRSAFRTTVEGLSAHHEEYLTTTPLMIPSHTDEDYLFRLGSTRTKQRTIVHHQPAEPQTIELDGIAWSEEIYAALEAVKGSRADHSCTSASSDDSQEAASLTFTPPQRSTSSSKSTSVLLNDERNETTGVLEILLNETPLDLNGLEGASYPPTKIARPELCISNDSEAENTFLTPPPRPQAEKERHQRDTAMEILRKAFSLPERRTGRSDDQHMTNGESSCLCAGPGEAHAVENVETSLLRVQPRRNTRSSQHCETEGEPSRPTSVPGVDFFRLPPPITTHLPTAKQPLTPSLLISLAPTLIKWRLLTFYGPLFHRTIQQDAVQDAYACLASEANQIHSVDWPKTWERLQKEIACASKSRLLRGGRKWLRSHFSSSASRVKSSESASVRDVIHTAATVLNIPARQLELAIESLALAFDPDARRFSGSELANMKQWSRLADVLLDDADVLTNPIGPAWMMKPSLGPTPTRSYTQRQQHRGVGKSKRSHRGKEKADQDGAGPIDMTMQQHTPCDNLGSLVPVLMAGHMAGKQRYFRLLERDEEEKVVFKRHWRSWGKRREVLVWEEERRCEMWSRMGR